MYKIMTHSNSFLNVLKSDDALKFNIRQVVPDLGLLTDTIRN